MTALKRFLAILLAAFMLCSLLTFPAVAEGEGDKAQATELDPSDNSMIYGTIATGGQLDWYKLTTGDEDAFYHFTLNNETGTKYIGLRVYDERDTELLVVGDYTSAGKSAAGNIKLARNTTYYLRINMSEGATGNYSFKFDKKLDEVSDDKTQAMAVETGKTYYQSADGATDRDWYKLTTGDTPAFYYFYMKNESGTSNLKMYIYNEREAEILVLGDYTGAGKEARGNIYLEANSTYYIYMYITQGGTGNYAFEITSQPDDYGNSKDTATEIRPNQKVSCSVDGARDQDWFVLHTGAGAREYKVLYNNETGTSNGHVVVYSERDEKLLTLGEYTGAGKSHSGTITLQGNTTYYFQAYLNDNGTGAHSFMVTQCIDGHSPSDGWRTSVEPTCIADGIQQRVCTVCGEVLESRDVDALGHDFAEKVVVREATMTEVGMKKGTCSRCGEEQYFDDYSKVWIIPVIVVAAIGILIGVINYIRAFRRKY